MLTLLLAIVMTGTAPLDKAVPASESYPLDTCAVAGKKLGSMGEPIVKVIDRSWTEVLDSKKAIARPSQA